MTINVPIKCDTCGTNLLLKIQCDDSLNHYDFHLHIYCKACGDEFDCTYSKMHGILPAIYRGKVEADAKYTVYYSPQLPVPLSSYYCDNKLHFLPIFQSLSLVYTPQIAIRHAGRIQVILDNVYPYRNILNELIPVMRKGNYNAFQKKMMKVLGINHANRNISSIDECRDVFAKFIEKIHANFATDCYQICIEKDVANLCQTCIREKSKLDGLKSDKLKDYNLIFNYLADCYNTHIRNALAHNNVEFEPETQVCKYYYKMNDNQTYDDFRLIDVCYMTFINVLHILEMYLVIHKLKKRLS